MRVALLISGHMRSYKIAYDSIIQNLIKPLQSFCKVDIFISTWNKLDVIDTPGGIEGKMKADPNINIDLQDITDRYEPVNILINNYNELVEDFYYFNFMDQKPPDFPNYVINNVLIAAGQLYGIYTANNLKKQKEREENFKYDLVFRARPDFYIHDRVNFKCDNELVVPILWKEPHNGVDTIYAIDDRFGFGASEIMDIYARAYLDLEFLIRSWREEDFYYNSNETRSQHLSLERILHRQMTINKIKMREDGLRLTRAV